MSLSGGAGADGEIDALRDTRGRLEDELVELDDKSRVGAVEPPPSRLLFRPEVWLDWPPGPSRFFFPSFPPAFSDVPGPEAAAAACWAAFLFLRSMEILWPGRMCARAHLWPNLQLPFTNQAQDSFCAPGSAAVWEKGQELPAVHAPTLKNLQGT